MTINYKWLKTNNRVTNVYGRIYDKKRKNTFFSSELAINH